MSSKPKPRLLKSANIGSIPQRSTSSRTAATIGAQSMATIHGSGRPATCKTPRGVSIPDSNRRAPPAKPCANPRQNPRYRSLPRNRHPAHGCLSSAADTPSRVSAAKPTAAPRDKSGRRPRTPSHGLAASRARSPTARTEPRSRAWPHPPRRPRSTAAHARRHARSPSGSRSGRLDRSGLVHAQHQGLSGRRRFAQPLPAEGFHNAHAVK